MSEAEPEEWSPEGLCEQFWDVDRKMHDRRFAFILGAGASVQSGIPAAGELVRRWLAELHRRLARGGQPLERWATAEALGIPGFTLARAPSFYSQVFARRFRHQPDEGYADLEDIMQGKDPSFGYSVLAHVLAETRHKLVITTNFDNLVGEALSIFTGTAPLVCGHESLANFIRVVPRRPVIVKIHRDLLMAPMNHADEIAALQAAWVEPLTRVFSAYTPIVIGYGGNDGSLMGFLHGLPAGAIPGGIYWCYYGPGGPPGPEIRQLVARHRGAIVPIEGFDELMLRLSARLRIPLLDGVIESKARARVDNYRRRVEELQARLFPPAAIEALEAAVGERAAHGHVPSDILANQPTASASGSTASAPSTPVSSDTRVEGPTTSASVTMAPRTPVSSDTRVDGSTTRTPAAAPPSTPVSSDDPADPPPPPREAAPSGPLLRASPPPLRAHVPSASIPPAPTRGADGRWARTPREPVPSDMPTRGAPGGGVLGLDGPAAPASLDEPTAREARSEAPTDRAEERDLRGAERLASLTEETGGADDYLYQETGVDAHAEDATARGVSSDDADQDRAAGDDGSLADWRWSGPLLRLPAAGEPLLRALQQVASDGARSGPWSVSLQARAELDRRRALDLLRAGLVRFPDSHALLLELAERLVDAPANDTVLEAVAAAEAALQRNPDNERALRLLVLLRAWQGDFAAAARDLRRLWQTVRTSRARVRVAAFAWLSGLLARLQGGDDARALALFKASSPGAERPVTLPRELVGALVSRLEPPDALLYTHLYQRLAGALSPSRLAAVEPRLAAVVPTVLTTLDALDPF